MSAASIICSRSLRLGPAAPCSKACNRSCLGTLRIAFNQDGHAAEPVARRYFDLDLPDWGAKGEGKLGTFTSLGFGGVVATQLWHHLYLGGGLCELPPLEFPHAAKPVPAAQPAPLAVA